MIDTAVYLTNIHLPLFSVIELFLSGAVPHLGKELHFSASLEVRVGMGTGPSLQILSRTC